MHATSSEVSSSGTAANVGVRARASSEQLRLWFLATKNPGETSYHMAYRLDLNGPVDPARIREAIRMLQDRHETLRTRFEFDGTSLFQIVESNAPAQFEIIDCTSGPLSQLDGIGEELCEEFAAEPIRLDRAPLFRCRLIRTSEERAILVFVMHHIIGDGWSHSVVTHDFCEGYVLAGNGPSGSLGTLALQFADFAEHQNDRLGSGDMADQVRFWTERLAGHAPLDLPITPPDDRHARARHRTWLLAETDFGRLRAALTGHDLLMSSVLLTAYERALGLMSGQKDFFVGTVVANRRDPDVAQMIGFFANTLLVPATEVFVDDIHDLLTRNQSLMLDLQENQEAPLDRVINDLNLTRRAHEDSPIQALFVVQNAPYRDVRIAGVEIDVRRLRTGEAKVPVTLFATEQRGTLEIEIEYDPRRVSDDFATDLLWLFREELAAIAGTSREARDDDSFVVKGPEEPTRLEATIVDLIWRRAASQPLSVALSSPEQTLTYEELTSQADVVASGLAGLGAEAGQRICTCLERGVDLFVSLLGILRAGMVWAPLDADAPVAFTDKQLQSIGPVLLVVDRSAPPPAWTIVRSLTIEDILEQGRSRPVPAFPAPGEPAYAIGTSGTSGEAKTVIVRHDGLANVCGWIVDTLRLTMADTGLWKTTVVFDAVLRELFPVLIAGGRLAIAPPDAQRDMELLRERIDADDISILHCVPTQLRALFELGPLPGPLRAIMSGGEPLPTDLARSVASGGTVELYNVYGPTEATVDVTFHAVLGDERGINVPIGTPIPNVRIGLARDSRLLPLTARGEIAIGGCAVAQGYLAGDSQRRFRTIGSLDRAYLTGDVGTLDAEKMLHCEGRVDRQIKISGVRIEPAAVEAVLRREAGIADAEVAPLPGDRTELVGFVFPNAAALRHSESDTSLPREATGWRAVFDDSYSELDWSIAPRDNTSGWTDSATRQPIPPREVLAVMDDAADKILRWRPQRILELGCGIGTLAFRLIPECRTYRGVDFAPASIDYCRHHAARMQFLSARFDVTSLDEFVIEPGEGFDAIVLNSVIQYLPGRDALDRLLVRLAPSLSPGGFFFIGDIRDRRLRDLHAFWKLRRRRGDDIQCQEILLAALSESLADHELFLHPDELVDWTERNGFAHPLLENKLVSGDNELVNFRFDATLCNAASGHSPDTRLPEVISNAPVERESELLAFALRSPAEQPFAEYPTWSDDASPTAGEPSAANAASTWTFATLASDPCRIAVRTAPLSAALPDCAAAFGHIRAEGPRNLPTLPNPGRLDPVDWKRFLGLVGGLPERLKRQLPHRMLPHRLIPLPYCPLLPNGKKHQRAIIRMARAPKRSAEPEYPLPDTLEDRISKVFQELLGTRFALDDDFFALGGSSLAATQARNWLQRDEDVSIPLRAFFNAPTPRLLAVEIAGARGSAGNGPDVRDEGTPLVLSHAQRRLWFIERLGVASPVYNIAHAVSLAGTPDMAALDRAIGKLCRRHVTLRSAFIERDGEPEIRILPPRAVGNLEILDGCTSRAAALSLLGQEQRRRFDLERGPLLRVLALPVGGDETVLCLICHHIVSDGWSMAIALTELGTLYDGEVARNDATLPRIAVDYLDLALYENRPERRREFGKQIEYWQRELTDAPARLPLPFDREPQGRRSWVGGKIRFDIDRAVADRLSDLALATRATPFIVLLSAFHVALRTLSQSRDTVIGTVLANRNSLEAERLIGFLVNPLALRIQSEERCSFRSLIAHVREVSLRGFENQDVPFDMLLEHLPVERTADYQAVFQVLFALQNNAAARICLGGLEATRLELPAIGAMFDLSLELRPEAEGFLGQLEYASELFDESTARRITGLFVSTLSECLSRPDQELAQLSLLPEGERGLLQSFGRGGTIELPADETICQLVMRIARETPDHICLLDGGLAISFAEVVSRAEELADRLRAAGCAPEVAVGICVARSPLVIIAMLGIQRAGAAPCYIDPDYPCERRQQLLNLAKCRYAIEADGNRFDIAVRCVDDGIAASEAIGPDADGGPVCRPRHAAFLAFTSGTTGAPKVVRVSHRAVCARLRANDAVLGFIGAGDRFAHCYSFNYDGGLVCAFWPLTRGVPIDFVPLPMLSDAEALGRFCRYRAISIFDAIPLVVATLYQSTTGLPALRLVVTGGDTCPTDLLVRQRAAGIEAAFANQYGPCEAVFNATTACYPAVGSLERHVTIGRPIPGCDIVITDPGGAPVPVGVFGEMWIGGPYLSDGYVDDDDANRSKFVTASFFGERQLFFRSGDRARWRGSGDLEFAGRIDRQIQINGMRVEPGEVEAALLALRQVEQAVVTVVDHDGTPSLGAFIVPGDDDEHIRPMAPDWQTAFDDLYLPALEQEQKLLDFSGWTQTARGEPIAPHEMQAWLQDTRDAIMLLGPRHVLEIGCGLGLIALSLAGEVEDYLATDISATAVAALEAKAAAHGVRLRTAQVEGGEAGARFAEERFDVVILNSVVQYLSGYRELTALIGSLLPLLSPDGAIFIGDVRDLRKSGDFYTTIERARTPDIDEQTLARRVIQARLQDEEAHFHPEAFVRIAKECGLEAPLVRNKPLDIDNEMINFRYDVVLRRTGTNGHAIATHCWTPDRATEFSLALADAQAPVAISGIRFFAMNAAHTKSDVLRGALALATRRGWHSAIIPEADDPALCTFLMAPEMSPSLVWRPFRSADASHNDPVANRPHFAVRARALREAIRGSLSATLPAHMVPPMLIFLDRLPTKPGGKIDEACLRSMLLADPPDSERCDGDDLVTAAMIDLWRRLLRVETLPLDADFFAFGGHSLLATKLVAEIRREFGVRLPVVSIFELRTPRRLTAALYSGLCDEEDDASAESRSLPDSALDRLTANHSQLCIWNAGGNGGMNHFGSVIRLPRPVSAAQIRRAAETLVARHPVLRWCFSASGDLLDNEPARDLLLLHESAEGASPTTLLATPLGYDEGVLAIDAIGREGEFLEVVFRARPDFLDGTSLRRVYEELAGYPAQGQRRPAGVASYPSRDLWRRSAVRTRLSVREEKRVPVVGLPVHENWSALEHVFSQADAVAIEQRAGLWGVTTPALLIGSFVAQFGGTETHSAVDCAIDGRVRDGEPGFFPIGPHAEDLRFSFDRDALPDVRTYAESAADQLVAALKATQRERSPHPATLAFSYRFDADTFSSTDFGFGRAAGIASPHWHRVKLTCTRGQDGLRVVFGFDNSYDDLPDPGSIFIDWCAGLRRG